MGFLSPNGRRAAFPLCSLHRSISRQALPWAQGRLVELGPGFALVLSSSSSGFIPQFWQNTPDVFHSVFPSGSRASIPQLVKTAISSLKAGKGITALHSQHFLGEFSCFLEIYSTYLSPLLNQFQLPH